jgi:hypothetical protein
MDQNKEHHWWGVAVQFTTYLNNHLRTASVDEITPEAAWEGRPID